jgi:hypothetical protein
MGEWMYRSAMKNARKFVLNTNISRNKMSLRKNKNISGKPVLLDVS